MTIPLDALALSSLALFAFALTLLALGVIFYRRSRRPSDLGWSAVGAVLLFILLFFASRFSLQLFGSLIVALDLRRFAVDYVLAFAVGAAAVGAAVGLVALARSGGPRWRSLLAYGLVGALGVLLVGGAVGLSRLALGQAAVREDEARAVHPALEEVRVPKGFTVQVFASGLQEPTALAFDDAGNLYYTELLDGNVVRLRDTNGDGAADEQELFASGFANPRGLAWHAGKLYVSSRGQINTLRDTNGDGAADENSVILDGLFSLDIQHSNNGIAFGPDGKLYIAIGGPRVGQLELRDKTYWYEGEPRDAWKFAGVLVSDPDGKKVELFARGLRNPYGLAFDKDGRLFVSDNGDETIPVPDGDELNLVERGKDYGYPYFFGLPPAWSGTAAPLVAFPPHTAPTGVVVYDGSLFPEEYRGNVLTALYWRGRPAAFWREIVRVDPNVAEGKAVKARAFIQGVDRPTALAVGPDGALYIADMRGGKADPDFPGVILRVSYAPP